MSGQLLHRSCPHKILKAHRSGSKTPNLTDWLAIHSEADDDGLGIMVNAVNAMDEAAGDDESHPLSNLLEPAAGLAPRYEEAHRPTRAV